MSDENNTTPRPAPSESRLDDSPCSVPCFECEYGHYETELRPYEYYKVSFDKEPVATFPDIPFEVCDKCGDICFGPEGLEAIEKHKENFRQSR